MAHRPGWFPILKPEDQTASFSDDNIIDKAQAPVKKQKGGQAPVKPAEIKSPVFIEIFIYNIYICSFYSDFE